MAWNPLSTCLETDELMEDEAGEERNDDANSSSGGGQGTAGSVAQSDPDHYESTLSRAVNAEAPRRNSQVPGLTITFAGVSKRYGRVKRDVGALRGIDLTIEPGVFGLLGRNGAGKTTLLQILATLLDATAGTIRIGPYAVPRDRWAVRPHLGYLPQEQGFYPTLTAEETLRYLATLQGIESREDAVARASTVWWRQGPRRWRWCRHCCLCSSFRQWPPRLSRSGPPRRHHCRQTFAITSLR